MVTKKLLNPHRLRRIEGGFSFIPHRFIIDGFLSSLSQKELLLYLFLCLVSERNGLSFYSYDAICISTTHRFKGLEEPAVIVLDAVQRSYPLIHPHWVFPRIFGTVSTVLLMRKDGFSMWQ